MQVATTVNAYPRRPDVPHGLVVTADPRIQEAAVAAMAAEGLKCESAENAQMALNLMRTITFNLILCDDECFRESRQIRLIELRAASPAVRIIYLLESRSATLFQDLRKRISQALSWTPSLAGATQASRQGEDSEVIDLLHQAAPMAALHLDTNSVIIASNDVAVYSGCINGATLPELGAFPLVTWSLAESQASHRRLLELSKQRLGLSEDSPTRLFAMRCSRLANGSLLMTGCEIADADDEANQAPRMFSPREERLQALEGFANGLAQEFAGLLGIVSGCSHLLRTRFPRSEEDPSLLSIAQPLEAAVRQGSDLISRLRAFGEQGPLTREELNAVEVLRDWSRSVRSFVGGDFRIEIESDRTSYAILGNRKALHEALMQLAGNAIDAIRQCRKATPLISMRVSADELSSGSPAVAIIISDNGCGIEEAIRDRIFDPFFTTKPSGTAKGLGLAMVAGTVRGHGGEVIFSSVVGIGSEFRIRLPVINGLQSSLREGPDQPRILLIDADRLTLEVNAHALRALGCQVVAGSESDFTAQSCIVQALRFDAVIIDAGIDEELGVAVATMARLSGVPIILFLTAWSQAEAPFLRHADRILRKPCSAWDLIEAIRVFRSPTPQTEKDTL